MVAESLTFPSSLLEWCIVFRFGLRMGNMMGCLVGFGFTTVCVCVCVWVVGGWDFFLWPRSGRVFVNFVRIPTVSHFMA